LEHFPKLGYYFISFRAIERAKEVQEKNNVVDALDHSLDGFIGAANVYLVVFKEGICSVSGALIIHAFSDISQFHFTDISGMFIHTGRYNGFKALQNTPIVLEIGSYC
jgi:hypothetical protein